MIQDIRELNKEDKIQKLIDHMNLYYSTINQLCPLGTIGSISSTTPPMVQLSNQEMFDIFEKIEKNIHFIAPSPAFTYHKIENNKVILITVAVETIRSTLEDLNDLVIKSNNLCIIFYHIEPCGLEYKTRIKLIEDDEWKSKVREKRINQVLDDEKSNI